MSKTHETAAPKRAAVFVSPSIKLLNSLQELTHFMHLRKPMLHCTMAA
jgi:hypothetical protein